MVTSGPGPLDVPIVDFTKEAVSQVKKCALDYRERLIKEAREIEHLQNPGGANKQVTPTHVEDANLRLRKPYLLPRKTSGWVYFWAAATVVCSFVGGLAGNNWDKGWGQALFIVMLVVGIFTGIAAVSLERR